MDSPSPEKWELGDENGNRFGGETAKKRRPPPADARSGGRRIGYIRLRSKTREGRMPSNIEIKARIADLPQVSALVATMSQTPPMTLRQRDTFFRCMTGRLKLRELETGESELIYYARADVAGARRSDYVITPVADSTTLKSVLRQALGETVVVEKTRVLYLVGQTRVHLDSVSGLGHFLELEVVLRPDQFPEMGHDVATDLMRRLGISESDLLATAYADMLTELATKTAAGSSLPSPPGHLS
jgi:adenylate cyclase class IV